ncbi:MAG: SBBP repeat-containing protein [Actinobacteria bacterium]|nr:SBBP repeat-containing protein [Actinomycetota bacterium]
MPRLGAAVIVAALAVALALGAGSGSLPAPAEPAERSSAILAAPLSFEPAAGRFGGGVDYVSHSVAGGTLYLHGGDATLRFAEGGRSLRFELLGAAPAGAVGLGELPGKVNSFVGNDRSAWRRGVPTYAGVRYRSVYPGIDLDFHGNQRRLEYDWRLAPGADPDRIGVALRGADSARITADGALALGLGGSTLRQAAPVAYQWIDGKRHPVAAAFSLHGERLGFALGAYDRSRPLVIDPVLSYSTYLGGSLKDFGFDVAVDPAGGVYISGQTESGNFPIFDERFPDQALDDAFVSKFEPDDGGAMKLAYSTYIGASKGDGGASIAVDAQGAVYLTGSTDSENFPTVDPLAGIAGGNLGGTDIYVVKLNPDNGGAVTIDYSTYVSGSLTDGASGIAVDAQGAAYVTGFSDSTDFPLQDQFQADQPGFDAVAFKLNPHAGGPVTLAYSTYLGGNGTQEAGSKIAVDAQGAAYVTGRTDATNFPLQDPLQTDQGGFDAFVTKLNPDAGGPVTLAYSTYLGGLAGDFPSTIAVDATGAAYVGGVTDSTDFPTSGALQTDQAGGDGFLTKFAPDAGGPVTLGYSTYLGGSGSDNVGDIALDDAGDAFVAGSTTSPDFPTAERLQAVVGEREAFVAHLHQPAPGAPLQLPFSTYFGGSANDEGNAIALGPDDSIHLAGTTESGNLPLLRQFQNDQNLADAFLAKLANPPGETPGGGNDGGGAPAGGGGQGNAGTPGPPVPDTRITRRPLKTVKTRRKRARVSFRFEAVTGTRLECAIDAKPFTPCTSPATFGVKATNKARRHRFRVRAVDALGHPDPTPATANFRVRRTAAR